MGKTLKVRGFELSYDSKLKEEFSIEFNDEVRTYFSFEALNKFLNSHGFKICENCICD